MGKEARMGLVLGAAACLMAVLVDWAIEEAGGRKEGHTGNG